jgi:MFS family permease
MLGDQQKKIADSIVKTFCFSNFWIYLSAFTLPIFFPLYALTFDVPGSIIGVVLGTAAFVTILTIPLVNSCITRIGIEESILYSSIIFGLSNCVLAFSYFCPDKTSFLWVVFLSQIMFGFSAAALTVGESALLLRYSRKEDREKNLGLFRAASGLGTLVAPLSGAALFVVGGYMSIFLFNGIGQFLISPFVYYKMKSSREEFLEIKTEEPEVKEFQLNNSFEAPALPSKKIKSFELL